MEAVKREGAYANFKGLRLAQRLLTDLRSNEDYYRKAFKTRFDESHLIVPLAD